MVKSESDKARAANTDTSTATIEDVKEPLAIAIGEVLAQALLKEEGIEQEVPGIVVVIESC